MPTVQTDDGRTLVFPEGMSRDDMAAALQKLPPAGKGSVSAAAPAAASSPEETQDVEFHAQHPVLARINDLAKTVEPYLNPVNHAIGEVKGAADTALNVGTAAANLVPDRFLPKSLADARASMTKSAGDLHEALQPENGGENIGKYIERAGEFMLGDAGAAKLIKPVSIGAKALTAAASGYGVTRAEGGSDTEGKVNAVIGGGLPVLLKLGGDAAEALGKKLTTAQIRPNAQDVAAGFNVDNLHKYGLDKLSLQDTLGAVHNRIVSLADQLRDTTAAANAGEAPTRDAAGGLASMSRDDVAAMNSRLDGHAPSVADHRLAVEKAIAKGHAVHPDVLQAYPDLADKAAMADVPGAKIDLGAVIDNVEEKLLGRTNQLTTPADELQHVRNAIGSYRSWANGLPGGPNVTIDEAQTAKRAIGLKGAWEYGKTAADNGVERVSNAIYSELKPRIEAATNAIPVEEGEAPRAKVKDINKQLGELMPIEQAIIRRMPVAARNNPLSLTDLMLLATGHPLGAAAHVMSRTMAGATLTRAGADILRRAAPLMTPAAQSGVTTAAAMRRRSEQLQPQDQ